jgi:MerR family transcriptional regulator, thiopeptide resistance regulator
MSGVTSRTLRHYDAVGLLTPAWTAPDGRRHYGRPELLRLQRILLLRELGLGLRDIAAVLETDDRRDEVTVLLGHRDRLLAERERLLRLARTVEATIESRRREEHMSAEKLFEGFANPYEAEARERWGDEAVDASAARIRDFTPEQAELARTGHVRVAEGIAAFRAGGVPVDDPRVQELVAFHHRVVSLFWTPDAQAYRGLGQMYVDDDRFAANYGGTDGAAYLRDAMAVYADTL